MYLLSNLWIIFTPNSNSSNSFHRIHVGGRRWNEKKNCATRGEYVISGHMSNRSIKSSASFAQIQSEVGPTSNNTVLSIGKIVTFSRNEWYCSFRSEVSSWKHTHSKRSEITKMNEWIVCARLERISAQKELNQIHSEFRVTFSLFYIKRVQHISTKKFKRGNRVSVLTLWGGGHIACRFCGDSYKKIRRYNNSPPYVMARWPPQQIPPLNFLDIISQKDKNVIQSPPQKKAWQIIRFSDLILFYRPLLYAVQSDICIILWNWILLKSSFQYSFTKNQRENLYA